MKLMGNGSDKRSKEWEQRRMFFTTPQVCEQHARFVQRTASCLSACPPACPPVCPFVSLPACLLVCVGLPLVVL